MIFVGRGTGAHRRTSLSGITDPAVGLATAPAARCSASAPPCRTEIISGRPAAFRLTTESPETTPAC